AGQHGRLPGRRRGAVDGLLRRLHPPADAVGRAAPRSASARAHRSRDASHAGVDACGRRETLRSPPFAPGLGRPLSSTREATPMAVLVTGGAGYIGSHMALALLEQGDEVVILDNLVTGVRAQAPAEARFVLGDVQDRELVMALVA